MKLGLVYLNIGPNHLKKSCAKLFRNSRNGEGRKLDFFAGTSPEAKVVGEGGEDSKEGEGRGDG